MRRDRKVSDTATLDRMYLEYSNLTGSKTYKELRLEQRIAELEAERRVRVTKDEPPTEKDCDFRKFLLVWDGHWFTATLREAREFKYWIPLPPAPKEGEQ